MLVARRRETCNESFIDGCLLLKVCKSKLGVDGVPTEDGVGDEGEAFTFEVLVGVVSPAHLPSVRVSNSVTKLVDGLALVQLCVDSSAVFFISEVAGDRDGLNDSPILLDGLGESVLAC